LAQVDYSKKPLSAISATSVSRCLVAARTGGKNIFGEQLHIPKITRPASATSVIQGSLHRVPAKKDLRISRLPEHLLYKIDNFSFGKDDASKGNVEEIPPVEEFSDIVEPHSMLPETISTRWKDVGDDGDSTSTAMEDLLPEHLSRHSSMLSVFVDTSIHGLRKSIQADYRPGLVSLLDPYCYIPPKVFETERINTGGPFIDLGLLEVGNQVDIILKVTNNTGDVVRIDATARNFESDDTKVLTYPSPLVHGFTRNVTVSFTVQSARKRSVVAFVEIAAVASRNGGVTGKGISLVDCPVHYRVDPQAKKDVLPGCTQATLAHLLTAKEYFPPEEWTAMNVARTDYRGLSLTFERRKEVPGSWGTRIQSTTRGHSRRKEDEENGFSRVLYTRSSDDVH
jgi:glycine cleavage system regulatory protein